MDRRSFNKVSSQALLWTALIALSCGATLAQDAAQNATPAANTTQGSTARSDGQIEMDVVHALDASKALKDDMITAATIQGEVTLSGTVSSGASSELAESLASRVTGVTKVNNELKVGNSQETQNAQAAPNADAPQTAESQPEQEEAASQPAPAMSDGPMPVPSESRNQSQAPPPPPQYARQPYQQAPPPPPTYDAPKGPVTIPQGTLVQLRTNEPINSKRAKDGTPVEFTVIQDVAFGGVLAIPRGATVHGVVSEVKQAGQLAGSPELALTITSLDLGGQSYPLTSDQFKVKGPSKGESTAGHIVGGALIGTIIGCAVGRGPGCAIGAGAGAAAGTAASAASSGPGVWIPAEARVDFHLAAPLTVTPVNAQEAARLAQGLYPGGPNLYRRGYGYGPYGRPYYADYPYGYPPVYYRPYFVTGGFYYWR